MHLSITLVDLAGYVALLLWGTHMVQTGVQRAYSPNLRSILGGALRNRISAFFAGLGVTAALQSSTATGLIVTGFAAAGLVSLVPALAVMLGANVGTTLIVQVLSFNVVVFSPALILIGVFLFRRDASPQTHDLGRVFIGFGLVLLALHQLIEIMSPYENSPTMRQLLTLVATAPLLDVILAAALTWVVHSSAAVVLLIMSMAAQGLVPLDAAFAFVLGANLGTAVNPILEGASGSDPASRRVPVGNFLIRAFGVLLALIVLPSTSEWIVAIEPDNARAVANYHLFFNLLLAVIFFPLLGPFAKLLQWMLPQPCRFGRSIASALPRPVGKGDADRRIGRRLREALRLVDVLDEMLRGARNAVSGGDRKLIVETRRLDNILDRLNTSIKGYLTSIDSEELRPEDHQRLNSILTFAMNLEQAGDVIDRSLLPHAAKRLKRGLSFSRSGEQELLTLMDRLIANLQTAASLFMTEDLRAARILAEEKVMFRAAETEATSAHFVRLRSGRTDWRRPAGCILISSAI